MYICSTQLYINCMHSSNFILRTYSVDTTNDRLIQDTSVLQRNSLGYIDKVTAPTYICMHVCMYVVSLDTELSIV